MDTCVGLSQTWLVEYGDSWVRVDEEKEEINQTKEQIISCQSDEVRKDPSQKKKKKKKKKKSTRFPTKQIITVNEKG